MQGNQTEKYTLLYRRLSNEDKREGTSLSIEYQETICQGGFLPKEQIHNWAVTGRF